MDARIREPSAEGFCGIWRTEQLHAKGRTGRDVTTKCTRLHHVRQPGRFPATITKGRVTKGRVTPPTATNPSTPPAAPIQSIDKNKPLRAI